MKRGETMVVRTMRLDMARLCSCDVIYQGACCPVCASEQFLWLEKVLGRVSDGANSAKYDCGLVSVLQV